MKLNFLHIILLSLVIFISSCDQEVSIGEPYEFEIELSKAFIDSKPANAEIFVNGKNSGKRTPDTLTYLSNGEHNITLKLYLFQDYNFTLDTDTNYVANFYYDYYAYPENFATVNLKSTPQNAKIYFDDSLLTSTTPFQLKNIYPGDHKFKITYPEHRADSLELFLRGGTNTKLDFFLEDTTVWVTYNRHNSPLTSYNIKDIFVDKNDHVWVATSDNGIYLLNGQRWDILNTDNSILATNHINKIVEDYSGNIWICTEKGLVKYDYSSWSLFSRVF